MARRIRKEAREEKQEEMLVRFGVSMSPRLLKRFDDLLTTKGYVNRSEAFRDLIRNALVEIEWEEGNKEILGTLTIIYNHEVRELSDRLEDLQHAHYDNIVSTMHVHLDKHYCLEVMVLRGMPGIIRSLANHIIGVKGVKHGQLVMTSLGADLD
jgi:CopG family nickel-responsive transcriptional regulator